MASDQAAAGTDERVQGEGGYLAGPGLLLAGNTRPPGA